jgi:hypothetical protein
MAGDKKCTPKQEKFAREISRGSSLADAYRSAFCPSPSTKPESIRTLASREYKKVHVRLMVDKYKAKIEAGFLASQLSRKERILKVLDQTIEGELSKDSSVMDSNRISAIQLMGKHLNLWGSETVVVQDRDSETLRDELAARLSKLLEKNPSESVPDDQVTH